MQYNSNSDSQDIVSLVGDMTGIDTTNEIKQITRAANEANKKIWSWIFQSYGSWQYDDGNNTDLPVATATLAADRQKYTLPETALTVRSVEYKNSGDVWSKLEHIAVDRISDATSEKEWNSTSAEPTHYGLINGVLKIYPASTETRTNALRIRFDRGSTTFASTDTTKTPGFASEFHEAVAIGASYYIARNKTLNQRGDLLQSWIDMENRIKEFYVKRWDEEYPPRINTNDTLIQYI